MDEGKGKKERKTEKTENTEKAAVKIPADSASGAGDDKSLSRSYNFNGAKVLLAEDNKMNLEIAARILSTANLLVDCAGNGREAVEAFNRSKEGEYAAILMDVHMPEMDGYQAARAIRAGGHTEAKTIPIIAMTADVFAEDVEKARIAGMIDHIGKPIDSELMFATLGKYIK